MERRAERGWASATTAVTVAMLTSLLAACASSGRSQETPAPERPLDLAMLIPSRGPDGLLRLPDGTPGSGPLDLSDAAEMFGGGQDVQAYLHRLGFVRGHMRTWGRLEPIDTFAIKIEEFSDAEGARAYLDSLTSLSARPGVRRTTVAGVPTASIVGPAELPNGEIRIVGSFVKGPRVYTLLFGSATRSHTIEELAGWLRGQSGRAP